MTYLLRRMRAQDRIEGREPLDWDENDYAVVDETRFVGFTRSKSMGRCSGCPDLMADGQGPC
jgi:hypothetical protein